jgi:hypothetical protein
MAREVGISKSSVQKLWAQNELKPHRSRTFKLSNDPEFKTKFWDIVGLYLNPPEQALVLCCDEKSQIQALSRSQPGLPLKTGYIQPGPMIIIATARSPSLPHSITCRVKLSRAPINAIPTANG